MSDPASKPLSQEMDESLKLTEQRDLASKIEILCTNIGKTSHPLRTRDGAVGKNQQLLDLWVKFCDNHISLVAVLPVDHLYHRDLIYAQVKHRFLDGLDKLKTWGQQPAPDPPAVPGTSTAAEGPGPNNGTSIETTKPKLAPIDIPKFDGTWQKWTPFIGLFDSLVHHNRGLSDIQKLQYLLTYLTGDAHKRVGRMELTNENYTIAYNLIQRVYNNTRRTIEDHVGLLLELPKLNQRSAQGILDMITALETAIEGLRKATQADPEQLASFIVTCVTRKLDDDSRERFEDGLPDNTKMPSIKQLLDFLEKRQQVLSCDRSAARKKTFNGVVQSKPTKTSSCALCDHSGHRIDKCDMFRQKTVADRKNVVKQRNLCFNCLGTHKGKCSSKFSCFHCKQKHHTLLHRELPTSSSHLAEDGGQVLLATTMIKVMNPMGQPLLFRALVDSGAQDTFITSSAATQLMLQRRRTDVKISGIGGAKAGNCVSCVDLHFSAHFPSTREFHTTALVLDKLTTQLPGKGVSPDHVDDLPKGIILADPYYYQPASIDIILGAATHAEIMKEGFYKINNNQMIVQNTALGWLISGKLLEPTASSTVSFLSITQLGEQLARFWEQDEEPPLSDNTTRLEEYYRDTTTRNEDGRYIVSLPRRSDVYGSLGASRNMAAARLINLEKTLSKNPHLAAEYRKFMQEYEELGHMTKVDDYRGKDDEVYYLPHHAVVKECSTSTKVRVVFNASAKTHTGLSLNSLLETGHKQQQDLPQILLRWRTHRIVVTADIEKMFRQILVAPADRDMQRILWRHSTADPISEYQLNTVTYGTAPATFLAVNTLLQLAKDECADFPLGAAVIERDFYVDDMLTGADTIDEVHRIQQQVTQLLAKGGMIIRKWTSNSAELMERIPPTLREGGDWLLNPDSTIKALGIYWDPLKDEFRMQIDPDAFPESRITKRQLLSHIATIFDPLGLVAPITFRGRVWMQQLWLEKTDWDSNIGEQVQAKWDDLRAGLHLINQIRIPRWTGGSRSISVQLHGFCDASERGYAAVVYSRTVDITGTPLIRLLIAKAKVAPLKNKQTLPRLELAGAVLLSQLVEDAARTMEMADAEKHYWCDSQITLAWIAKEPTNWAAYVANRVAAIQRTTNANEWHYVNTKENPADVASRGCSPQELVEHPLWWNGPAWLKDNPGEWPIHAVTPSTDLEKKKQRTVALISQQDDYSFTHRFSSFSQTVRILAWILRLVSVIKTKGPLTVKEIDAARIRVLLLMQMEYFETERVALLKGSVPRGSSINNLAPFLDDDGLIRVGGRLRHAHMSQDYKNPILLPRNHPLTAELIRQIHLETLHGGAQMTLSLLRRRYWISNGRAKVQAVIRSCRKCQRFAVASRTQAMGDFPAQRINPAPAFAITGVDYAGPFLTRCSKGRGIKTTKCYIAVFVCFTTKALHLELVSDLTTDAFLAALKRFIARRGRPLEIHSDNGKNFQGAARELQAMMNQAVQEATELAASMLANDGIQWKFIPVASPHFGGLWEAGVKSVKKHLKRTLDETKLTFEEFTTLLCQIEACLNSRPLAPISTDPEDYDALTPGHFLTTRALVAPPEPHRMDATNWRNISRLHQQFWQRWSDEYRSQLQTRSKWTTRCNNAQPGGLVLLKDKMLPPTKWALGRIRATHPGTDGLVRVVTIDTVNRKGFKQPLTNLCLLPNTGETMAKEEGGSSPSSTENKCLHVARSTPGCHSWRLMQIIFLLLVLQPVTRAVTITRPNPGVLVETLGQCQFRRGTLRVQMDYAFGDMDTEDQQFADVSRNLSALLTTWETKHENDPSDRPAFLRLFERFERMRAHVGDRIAEIRNIRTRKRRGILGSLLTSVFGVNDEAYAEIDLLKRNQATLSEGNLRLNAIMEQQNQHLEDRHKELTHHLQSATTAIQKLKVSNDRNALTTHLLAVFSNALGYMDDMTAKYDAIEKAVIGRSNLLDFLPLKQLNEAITNASEHLPRGNYVHHVPEDRVETAATSEGITIYGFFPIVAEQEFNLVHLTPIPELRNDTFFIPRLSSRTMAINYFSQVYTELSEEQLEKCRRTAQESYICDVPLIHSMDLHSCNLMTELFNITTACTRIPLEVEGVLWQKLLAANQWVFSTNTSHLVDYICEAKRESLHLIGTGIISISEGCIIKTNRYFIASQVFLNMPVIASAVRELSLPAEFEMEPPLQLCNPMPASRPTSLVTSLRSLPPMLITTSHHTSYWALGLSGICIGALALLLVMQYRNRVIAPKPEPAAIGRRNSAPPSLRQQLDRILAASPSPQHVQATEQ